MRMWMAALAAAMMTAAPVAAQQIGAPVDAKPGRPYRFKQSGITAPAELDGMRRADVRQLGTDELDVFAVYQDGPDAITVYVYRSLSGGVPVWFDRARASIEQRREMFGNVTPVVPTTFTPPGQSSASGLMAGWTLNKAPYRGTALAILPVGEWLVKVRYSSSKMDGAAVAARIPAVLGALEWPKTIPSAPAAAPVADCAAPLVFSATAAPVTDAKALQSAALSGGLVAAAEGEKKGVSTASSPVWCRDPAPAHMGAAYRRDGATDSYLLAISDSGRGFAIAPDVIARELGEAEGRKVQQWSVALYEPGSIATYTPMTGLPAPDTLIAALNRPILARTTTWGKKRNVSINPAFFK
ncbi:MULTISPECIES: hypothetical protein [unclassified Sphingomonas]|uniref:hypothetical protein n=1 Tax=unclassified Sphingomonas TaxID=196159 RepID=UPI0006F739DD|nr:MULTISPECIES: hypothetical protein [unclassified Sphingomonas]KQM61339.1 hypothetical protein ASE65_07295 [Sphingomonas sp. Leaf16]KQN12434.1 hypothetical protein ASE81_08305 [Sphingomonas sp. Leaf29]KQN18915.1 hypothetical protein ASE83_08230 [Sphingomonas sp. Leaf32]